MTSSTDIATLARLMAADFSNQEQAFENPPFYAHIRVCMRPLPLELLSGVSFLLSKLMTTCSMIPIVCGY